MPDKFGDKIRLQHALDAMETIEGYVSDADFGECSENSMMRDMKIYNLRRSLSILGVNGLVKALKSALRTVLRWCAVEREMSNRCHPIPRAIRVPGRS